MIGIDYSMSSAGIVIGTSDNPNELHIGCYRQRVRDEALKDNITILEPPSAGVSDEERYYRLAETTVNFIKSKTDERIVYIEDYSFQSKGNTFNIGEATGALKQRLWLEGFEIQKLSPGSIKKFASGKGNANKTGMLDAFIDKTGYDWNESYFGFKHPIEKGMKNIPAPITDIIDAYWILQYALAEFHGEAVPSESR